MINDYQKVDDNLERELEQLKTSQGLLGQTSQQMGEQVSFDLIVLAMVMMVLMVLAMVMMVLMVMAMVIIIFLSILVDHDGDDQPADENGWAASWYYLSQ